MAWMHDIEIARHEHDALSGLDAGSDLREGIPTLPVLYALSATAADPDAVRLRELVSRPIESDAEVAEALRLLRESPGMAHARADMSQYAERARELLVDLPDVPARAALAALVDLTIYRSR